MDDALVERVEALERAVTDGDHDLSALADDAAALDRLDAVEERIDEIADRVDELEAATQALRGYVGNIRSVNQDVETRADTALAKAESLEAAMAGPGRGNDDTDPGASADESLSRSRRQADDSGRSRRQHGTTNGDCASATPDGGHSTSNSGEATTRRERCHACGQPRTPGEYEGARNPGATDSLTTQSVFDGSGVDTGTTAGGEDAFTDAAPLGDGPREDDDCEDLVPENDPLVSDDDDPGGLRRLRELL